MLRRLRVARTGIEPKRGGSVPDVGSGDHRVKESRVVVNADILDLQRVDFCTGLLIEEVLLHRFVNLFTGHLVLEVATNGLVHFVHVSGDILSRQDGWCTKDSHGLTTVVIGVRRVATGAWVETVVDGEVTNFVVSGDGFTRGSFVILDPVRAVKIDEVVVKIVNDVVRVGIKSGRKELRSQSQTGVLSVDGRRHREVLVEQVIGVPVIAKDGVAATFNGFF